jgi:hypothetical protein
MIGDEKSLEQYGIPAYELGPGTWSVETVGTSGWSTIIEPGAVDRTIRIEIHPQGTDPKEGFLGMPEAVIVARVPDEKYYWSLDPFELADVARKAIVEARLRGKLGKSTQ